MPLNDETLLMVVCLDDTDVSATILPTARRLARLSDAEVHLLRVVDLNAVHESLRRGRGGTGLTGYTDAHVAYSTMPSQEGRIGAVVEPRGQAIRRVRQTTEIALTAQLEGFPDNSRAVVLDHKDAAQAIVEYARDVGAGLIAMATHSRRPIA